MNQFFVFYLYTTWLKILSYFNDSISQLDKKTELSKLKVRSQKIININIAKKIEINKSISNQLPLFRWIKLESTMTSPSEVQILLVKFPLLFNNYVIEWLKSNMTSQHNNILGSDWLNCPTCLVTHARIAKEFKVVQKTFKILKVCQKVISI